MEALAITVLFSVLLGLLFMAAFVWDHHNRGEDDPERESLRPLDDDDAVAGAARPKGR